MFKIWKWKERHCKHDRSKVKNYQQEMDELSALLPNKSCLIKCSQNHKVKKMASESESYNKMNWKLTTGIDGWNPQGSHFLNSLWSCDTLRHDISRSLLVQAVAWCHKAPNHYLIQCWLIISNVLRNTWGMHLLWINKNISKNKLKKLEILFPWTNKLNVIWWSIGLIMIYSLADANSFCHRA